MKTILLFTTILWLSCIGAVNAHNDTVPRIEALEEMISRSAV